MQRHAPAPEVMACRDRQERARVIVEPGEVAVARGLDHRVEIAADAVEAVVEPPGWPEPERGPVPCHRRKFPRIAGLVQREDDEAKARVVAHPVQQRVEPVDPVHRARDVGAHVRAEPVGKRAVGGARGAGVDLHDHAVFGRHLRHFDEHVTVVTGGLFARERASSAPCRAMPRSPRGEAIRSEGRARRDRSRSRRARGRRRGARGSRRESRRSGRYRRRSSASRRIVSACPGRAGLIRSSGRKVGITRPGQPEDAIVIVAGQVRQGGVGRRQNLDAEPVEQRAGPVRGIGEPLRDLIMYKI
jgi:hypothetical protein